LGHPGTIRPFSSFSLRKKARFPKQNVVRSFEKKKKKGERRSPFRRPGNTKTGTKKDAGRKEWDSKEKRDGAQDKEKRVTEGGLVGERGQGGVRGGGKKTKGYQPKVGEKKNHR